MRLLAWSGCALFALSAALQWNDPDPLPWMAIYGAAAVACVVRRRPFGTALPAVVAVVAAAWALTIAPRVVGKFGPGDLFATMKAERPVVEEGREALGLAIVAVACGAAAVVRWRDRQQLR